MGGFGSGAVAYRSQGTVSQFPAIRIKDLMRQGLAPGVFLTVDNQPIHLSWIRGTQGGQYPMLICPRCQRRRAALFRIGGRWQCRVCGRLVYPVQHESETDKAFTRAWKARNKLVPADGKSGIGDPIPNWMKPKGMHWNTFYRLREKANAIARQSFGIIDAENPLLQRPSGNHNE